MSLSSCDPCCPMVQRAQPLAPSGSLLLSAQRAALTCHVTDRSPPRADASAGERLCQSATTSMIANDVARLKKGEVDLGVRKAGGGRVLTAQTSIMAVAYKGGVILGADSRTTMGPYIVCSGGVRHAG